MLSWWRYLRWLSSSLLNFFFNFLNVYAMYARAAKLNA